MGDAIESALQEKISCLMITVLMENIKVNILSQSSATAMTVILCPKWLAR